MSLALHEERFATLPNGLRLCYSEHGSEAAPALVLIAGLGLQMVYWPAALIDRLVESGLRVICFDNRDAGRSGRSSTPHPSQLQQLRGKAPDACYGLEQMADDTAQLLEHLNIGAAHLVGMSMGGMIAQTLAYRHPGRVKSLVSIFSTTGNRRVGQPAYSTLWRLSRAKAPKSRDEAIASYSAMMSHIGDASAPDALAQWQDYSALAWVRNGERADARALFRQIGAILRSGDRTAQLKTISAPSLVLHGDLDRMVHPSGGEATARAIPRATHQVIRGMRHQIDSFQAHQLSRLIADHIQRTQDNSHEAR
ncbi:alpha/beta hydrolase [Pseudomonas sp. T]|nr:alpha/beta hydrolase [Pseudomonas sp. T]